MNKEFVKSHFLDSGAFSLWTKSIHYYKEHGGGRWDYYETDEFWEYMDDYADFIKKYKIAIDLYANVDVIPNPQLTWRNQRYLEKKHGLNPVPVVHYPTNTKWLKKYMNAGYKIIGLGGLVGSMKKKSCQDWIDECFDVICDTPNRLPQVKIHGFGVSSYNFFFRYPWWSVDSTSWKLAGGYGGIYVPHKRKGKFVFTESPYIIKISVESPCRKTRGNHLETVSKLENQIIKEWLKQIGIPFKEASGNSKKKKKGVNRPDNWRYIANLLFFEEMIKTIPKWPWPFKSYQRSLL